MLPRGFGRRQA